MEEKNNYDVIKEIEEIDSTLDILEAEKIGLIVNNPEAVLEKDFETLAKIQQLYEKVLNYYSSSAMLEEAIDSILEEIYVQRDKLKKNVPEGAVEEEFVEVTEDVPEVES